jgi:hypothetical protein
VFLGLFGHFLPVLVLKFPFFGVFVLGAVGKPFVYYFVDASGCFGLYVFYNDFAVSLSFEEGFGVS